MPDQVRTVVMEEERVSVKVYPLSGVLDGFLPYDYIAADAMITVPQYRQMNIVEELTVLGELFVQGSVNMI